MTNVQFINVMIASLGLAFELLVLVILVSRLIAIQSNLVRMLSDRLPSQKSGTKNRTLTGPVADETKTSSGIEAAGTDVEPKYVPAGDTTAEETR